MGIRLLNVRKLTLRKFEQDVPPYVIASHRWDDAETTYEEFKEGRNKNNQGYRKVIKLCDAVRKFHPSTRWLWIDTCCIDQDSSADVQEAINSMFRWYRRAAFCLAYLEDVSYLDQVPESDGRSWHLAQSSWFTRGWTLQELLAPRIVLFLSKEQQIIGRKGRIPSGLCTAVPEDIGPEISRITNIPEAVLADYKTGLDLTVGQKLAWMTGRRTTRIEDMAYCMLGIFGIFMPIIYGEGSKASVRLRREIDEKFAKLPEEDDLWKDFEKQLDSLDDGASIESSQASESFQTTESHQTSKSVLPHKYNNNFIGRDQELSYLEETLDSIDSSLDIKCCVLHGLRGMGKTETAIEYVRRHRHKYDAVYWIYADNDKQILDDYVRIGIDLGLIHGKVEKRDRAMPKVLEYLQDTTERWLLVFDDLYYIPDERLDYFPSSAQAGSRIIATTRCPPGGITNHSVELLPFDPDTSARLLLHMIGEATADEDVLDSARELSDLLEGWPIALVQASVYIKKRVLTVERFLALYKKYKDRIGRDAFVSMSLRKEIRSAWEPPLSDLSNMGKDMLNALIFFNPDRIDTRLVLLNVDLCSADDIRWDIDELYTSGLVEQNSDVQRSWSIHGLLQKSIMQDLSSSKLQLIFDKSTRSFISTYLTSNNKANQETTLVAILPHVIRMAFCLQQKNLSLRADAAFIKLLVDTGGVQFKGATHREECAMLHRLAKELLTAPDVNIEVKREILEHIDICLSLGRMSGPIQLITQRRAREKAAFWRARPFVTISEVVRPTSPASP